MPCRICGRASCTESFHSAAEVERLGKYCDLSFDELLQEAMDLDRALEDAESRIAELEAAAKREQLGRKA